MTSDQLVASARAVWTRMAGVPVEFADDAGVTVVCAPDSELCPPGWAGIVVIGGAGIATAPDRRRADLLRDRLRQLSDGAVMTGAGDGVTDPDRVCAVLPVTDVLGPATLAYLSATELTEVDVAAVESGRADLGTLLAAVTPDEAGEADVETVESDVFVVRRGARVVAAAGYQVWLGTVAHLCVLTATDARGEGLARAVASAAVADALRRGLLPQWRARPKPSRRVARALGFRELGAQLSIQLAEE